MTLNGTFIVFISSEGRCPTLSSGKEVRGTAAHPRRIIRQVGWELRASIHDFAIPEVCPTEQRKRV